MPDPFRVGVRPLGRTGLSVSEIGFGAWGIGGATPGATSYGRTDDSVSLAALDRAIERGIRFFDTSAVYGYGHSEALIGSAIRGRRDEVFIATKGGLAEYGSPADFSAGALRRSLEGSLKRLGTDVIDLYQLHNPGAEMFRRPDGILDCMTQLRAEGAIRAFGVSVRTPEDGLAAIDSLAPDAIQTNFNMMDQRAIDCGLFDRAERDSISIIARTPLNFGFLTNKLSADTVFAANDHRSRWPRAQIARWVKGAAALIGSADETEAPVGEQTPSQFALRYCLSFSAVTSVIPGMLSAAEVEDNAHAAQTGGLSDAELRRIREIYEAHDRFCPTPDNAARAADPGKVDATPYTARWG